MKDNNKILKNLQNNSQIMYSLFDKDNFSHCIINKNLIFSIKINDNEIQFTPHISHLNNEDLLLNNIHNIEHNTAHNIAEYLSYVKSYLIDNDKEKLYNNFLNFEFKEKFPSFIYECAMIEKLHNEQLLNIKSKAPKQKIK